MAEEAGEQSAESATRFSQEKLQKQRTDGDLRTRSARQEERKAMKDGPGRCNRGKHQPSQFDDHHKGSDGTDSKKATKSRKKSRKTPVTGLGSGLGGRNRGLPGASSSSASLPVELVAADGSSRSDQEQPSSSTDAPAPAGASAEGPRDSFTTAASKQLCAAFAGETKEKTRPPVCSGAGGVTAKGARTGRGYCECISDAAIKNEVGENARILRRSSFVTEALHGVPASLLAQLSSNTTRLLQLFKAWDLDGNGSIGPDELERACMALRVPGLERQHVAALFRTLDINGNGKIGLTEIITLKAALDRAAAENPAAAQAAKAEIAKTPQGGGVLRRYVLKPFLGALWKQPLQPHHALDLEPEWMSLRDERDAAQEAIRAARDEHCRYRFRYEAGLVPNVEAHCVEMLSELQQAADLVTHEMGDLLSEVRQADLKLQEMRLAQAHDIQGVRNPDDVDEETGAGGADAGVGPALSEREKSDVSELCERYSLYLQQYGYDLESSIIALERFTASDARHLAPNEDHRREKAEVPDGSRFGTPAHGLAGPRIKRWISGFAPQYGQLTYLRNVSSGFGALLFLYFVAVATTSVLDSFMHTRMRSTCELHHYACAQLPQLYTCSDTGNLTNTGNSSAFLELVSSRHGMPSMWWEDADVVDSVCVKDDLALSWINMVSVPLLVLSTVLPLLMLRGNTHPKTVQKILLWTPVVPLVMLQVTLRAVSLTSVVVDSYDTAFGTAEAMEAWCLLLQVVVFIFMDAMNAPAPKLRIVFAIVLLVRFCESFLRRSVWVFPAEQLSVLPQDGYLKGFGTSSRQSFIRSIDWTVLAMLGASIVSVLLHPRELAVVRLRCDVLSYINWRDHYIRRMTVRAHRRDNEIVDAVTMFAANWRHAKHSLRGAATKSGRSFTRLKRAKKKVDAAHAVSGRDTNPARRNSQTPDPNAMASIMETSDGDSSRVEAPAAAEAPGAAAAPAPAADLGTLEA